MKNHTKTKIVQFEEKLNAISEKVSDLSERVNVLSEKINQLDLWRANVSGKLSIIAIVLFILQVLNLLASLVKNFLH